MTINPYLKRKLFVMDATNANGLAWDLRGVRRVTSLIIMLIFFARTGMAQPEPSAISQIVEPGGNEVMPLWELGVGGGATFTPDYPGSDQNHLWAIPFPYGVYRGEILHSDRRGGTRARLLRSVHYEVNVSAGGGLPSSSGKNDARTGMPNLEFLGEFGPRLMVDLATFRNNRLLRFGLPLRAAFSTNGQHLTDRGFVLAPELLLDYPRLAGSYLDAFGLLTINFSDKRFAAYFYDVPAEFATPERPAYLARGGYLLTDLTAGLTLHLPAHVRLSLVGSLQFLEGSSNRDSPLYRTTLDSSVSMVAIWVFGRSAKTVVAED